MKSEIYNQKFLFEQVLTKYLGKGINFYVEELAKLGLLATCNSNDFSGQGRITTQFIEKTKKSILLLKMKVQNKYRYEKKIVNPSSP